MKTRRLANLALAWACAGGLLGAAAARAQDDSPDLPAPASNPDVNTLVPHSVLDSKVVKISLQQAATWIKTAQYTPACTALQDITDRYPNHLVNLGNGVYRGAHDYAVELLLSMPADALALYRQKYDAEAKAALDAALAERDPARLQQMLLRFA